MRQDDHRQLGQYLLLSHEGTRDRLRCVPPEADALVEIARHHAACLGARALTNGGRHATVSLVSYHDVEAFIAKLRIEAGRRLAKCLEPLVLPITGGP